MEDNVVPAIRDPGMYRMEQVNAEEENESDLTFTQQCGACTQMFIKSNPINKCSHCGTISNRVPKIHPFRTIGKFDNKHIDITMDIFGRKTQFWK
jgi:hypothetical protein